MGVVQKILFPYTYPALPAEKRSAPDTAIFFGTDFYNLPIGSDQPLFIERTNQMLAYVRRHFPNCRLLYQPHPNEKDEYTLLHLTGFEVGKRTIADVLLFEQAPRIAGVFASCSWAAASAYSMGCRAGVFLDLLKGAIPDDTMTGYRSYFAGFPDSFFIRSFEQNLPPLPPERQEEINDTLRSIERMIGEAKTIWFLSSDPAYVVHASLLAHHLKRTRGASVHLLAIQAPRWRNIEGSALYRVFDSVISLRRQIYTARPQRFFALLRNMLEFRRLPIQPGDTLVSFAHAQFAENCILSWYPRLRKVLMFESRWHHFNYEDGWKTLPPEGYRVLPGVHFFNRIVEPLFGLKQTIYKEYADGKGTNVYRYALPLESVYDAVFVLQPPTSVPRGSASE